MLFVSIAQAQEQVSFGIYQDLKLATSKDNHGNTPFTTDLIFNVNLEGNQFEYYYFTVQAQYEHANLNTGYLRRYNINALWNFNKLIIDDLNAGIGVGIGMLHRNSIGTPTYSIINDISYPINNWLELALKNEFVKRSDLPNKKLGYNLSFGVKIRPFN